jgi:Protein implicated in ribosomal biogenesis, Nop56p homolog
MQGTAPSGEGWFEGIDRDDGEAATEAIRDGTAEAPVDWPSRAVESGFADDEEEYYAILHDASMAATRAAVQEYERSDDRQLRHAVRAIDDMDRNLL